MKKHIQKGFTLIELMIVVAIIGILAAVAVPQYQDYTIRSQISEGLSLMDEHKTAIGDFYAQNGRFATGVVSYGLSATPALYVGTYVTGVTVAPATGVISATYGNRVSLKVGAANTLNIGPVVLTSGNLVWVCGKATAPVAAANITTALPAVVGTGTTVLPRYLPTSCRA